MLGVSSAPVTTAAQASSFLLPYSIQTSEHGLEALAQWVSVCNGISKSSPKGSAVAHPLQESFPILELSKAFLYWT